jgi:hypothetical protein
MVCVGLPTFRGVGHHAPSILLGDLDFSIALLSLESHWHLCISIIDSIVGKFPAVLLVSLFVIRFSFNVSHIVHPQSSSLPMSVYQEGQ